jgi:hypothetical protein
MILIDPGFVNKASGNFRRLPRASFSACVERAAFE